nr:hypothetical protein [Rhodococcus sp. 06-1059B-a]
MTIEFVTIDAGRETDWIDPVIDVRETETHWLVDNGLDIYAVEKRPGRTIVIRERVS